MIKKITSFLLVLNMVVFTSGILSPSVAIATSISNASAEFGRLKASTASDYIVVKFNVPSGIQAATDTITLTFGSGFTLAAESADNFDVDLGNAACDSSPVFTDRPVSLTPGSDWGVDVTGQVITFTPGTSDTLAAGNCIRFQMGTAATTGNTGSPSTVTNSTAGTNTITIAGNFGDTGVISVPIVDDDQVTITASVSQAIAFDLDTGLLGTTENNTPYTVPLGQLSTSSVTVSNTSSINMIIAEGWTNATGGMNVTVRNANGAEGLKSASTPADFIPSTADTMVAGTANYGICVATANLSAAFIRSSTYDTTCALSSQTNTIPGLTDTPTEIFSSTGPVSSEAHAEIVVNAAISSETPAHSDYVDTLTFIATASY